MGIWVSLAGLGISLYTMFSPTLFGNLAYNLAYLVFNGIMLALEGPIVLVSFKFQRSTVALLWLLFLLRIVVVIGETWLCSSHGNCAFAGFWTQLSFGLRSQIVELTFGTAFMAQIGFILGKPIPAGAMAKLIG